MLKIGEEFIISGYTFKYTHIKPTKLLSLATLLSNGTLESNETVFDEVLKSVEVKIENKWTRINEGDDVWFPATLSERLDILQELVLKYVSEYLTDVFKKPTD